MVKYRINQAVVYINEYVVEAESEAEAIHLVFRPDPSVLFVSHFQHEIDETRGLNLDDVSKETLSELRKMGYSFSDSVLDSIVSIEKEEEI